MAEMSNFFLATTYEKTHKHLANKCLTQPAAEPYCRMLSISTAL